MTSNGREIPAELPYELTDEYLDSLNDEGMCEFFLEYACGYDPSTGQCSLAGSEDCDWECPRTAIRTPIRGEAGK